MIKIQRIICILIYTLLFTGCIFAIDQYLVAKPVSLSYDHSPDNIVLFADVQPYPGGPEPEKECLASYQPRLRIWGDGLTYVNIVMQGQPAPYQWEGKLSDNEVAELLQFLESYGFFKSWDPGSINPAGTWFRMGATLRTIEVRCEGGDLDPPLYHKLIFEKILPHLIPLPNSGSSEERIIDILKPFMECYQQVFGTPNPQ